jgi:hypothetical protein
MLIEGQDIPSFSNGFLQAALACEPLEPNPQVLPLPASAMRVDGLPQDRTRLIKLTPLDMPFDSGSGFGLQGKPGSLFFLEAKLELRTAKQVLQFRAACALMKGLSESFSGAF